MENNRESKQKQVQAEGANEYINAMTAGGRAQMLADHDALRKKERHIYDFMSNTQRNRFANIVLFNEGAVILETTRKDETSYIHATQLKSRFGNYIMAQAPKSDTLLEWYRMIWQYNIQIIVCLIPLEDKNECVKYFEKKAGKKVKCKRFTMRTFTIRQEDPITVYEIRFINSDVKGEEKERVIHIVHYAKWQIAVQPDPRHIVKIMKSVWSLEGAAMKMNADKAESLILVHGTSGVRRTGAFVVTSMICRQIRDRGTMAIVAATSTVRRFRYGVMRNRLIFGTTLEAIINYAADRGQLNRTQPQFVGSIKIIRSALLDSRSHRDQEED